MTIYGEGPDFADYMRDFIKKSSWNWNKCEKCGNWVSLSKKRAPCPLCPPVKKNAHRTGADEDAEVYDPVTKSYYPKALFE